MYVCMYVCMHVCMHACMYVCVCIYTYICNTYIYIYIYIYTHTHMFGPASAVALWAVQLSVSADELLHHVGVPRHARLQ